MDNLTKVANRFLLWSPVVLTILFAVQLIGWVSSDDLYWPRVLCVVAFVTGLLLYIIWGLFSAFGETAVDYHIYRMRPKHMDSAVKLSESLLPSIPTKRELKALYHANNAICQLQYRTISFLGWEFNTHTGLYSALPMTSAARRLLENEELNGLKFTSTHIVKENRPYKCLYIGSVGAKGIKAKAHISGHVQSVIHDEFMNRGVEVIFTRPTTKDGLRVAKRFGFVPVSQDTKPTELDRLYCLERRIYLENL